jgi:hypothetical protein
VSKYNEMEAEAACDAVKMLLQGGKVCYHTHCRNSAVCCVCLVSSTTLTIVVAIAAVVS